MTRLTEEGRIAANRFGLGLRPDQADRIATNPKAYLKAQIDAPHSVSSILASIPSATGNMGEMHAMQREKNEDAMKKLRQESRRTYVQSAVIRLKHAVQTEQDFRERLVHFWVNHFSISTKNAAQVNLIIDYELKAIRPHVTASFTDMLIAVAQHPAMLLYLDNATSFSPDSRVGKRRNKGLNENLAREILELHTLGVQGGYTQADVLALAKLITGWSVNRDDASFQFRALTHEPDNVTLLGKTYPPQTLNKDRLARGEEALRDIARHPSTAQFIATKLARHFIADNPPASAVDALAETFRQTNGNLRDVYHTLIDLPEAWASGQPKLKSSTELVISAARLANAPAEISNRYFLTSLKELGNAPFTADSPAGFPDTAQELLGSDVVMRRIGWAPYAAKQVFNDKSVAPDSAAHRALGESLSDTTYKTITSTEDRKEAYAFLFASPEFQRR